MKINCENGIVDVSPGDRIQVTFFQWWIKSIVLDVGLEVDCRNSVGIHQLVYEMSDGCMFSAWVSNLTLYEEVIIYFDNQYIVNVLGRDD